VALAAAFTIGCGSARPPLVPVAGVVTLDGRPVSGGAVRVIPQNARAATGTIGPDGRFTLGTFAEADGCVVGTHVVEVMPPPSGGDERSPPPAKPVDFPTRYISAGTSGLTITVTGPTTNLVITLSTDK
jgi:hypothetical protein